MAALWKELLKSYPPVEVAKAFRVHFTEGIFFPKPAEIIQRIRREEPATQEYKPFTAADIRAAEEARDSPEAKKFFELVGRLFVSDQPKQETETRRKELKNQVRKVTA